MTHINQRHDYSNNWTIDNPVLQDGEVGWEKDTRKSKLGDGVTAWVDLPYTVSAINATKADVGLGNVDNTHDIDKPVSTAQKNYIDNADSNLQTQVNSLNSSKAPLASPTFTGDPKAPTPATTDNDTSIATTAMVQAVGALARAKKWGSGTAYAVGDVVSYGGGLYRCLSAPTTGTPPILQTSKWEVVRHPDYDGWAQIDPYFVSDALTNAWQTFWKGGTVNSLGFTTTAGEFESGTKALKVDLALSSSQRIYPLTENIVKGGEVVQVQVRAKMLSGSGAQIFGDFFQASTGLPEPFGGGDSSSIGASMEGTQNLTTSWATYTFTFVMVNAKPRANPTVIVQTGAGAAAVVSIDWIKTSRKPDLAGMAAGSRAPGVWHSVGATGEPAFQNGWVNFDGRVAQFRRDGNFIRLRGIVKTGTVNTVIFNLPAGFRPTSKVVNDVNIPVASNNAFGILSINGNGDVILSVGSNAWADISVQFPVDML